LKGVVNLVTVLLIVYLTYFFTVFFATRSPVAKSTTEAEKALAKKAEDLRAQEHKLLSSYGWVNPATKSVRIPVERAMELIAAENAQPLPTATPTAANVAATPGPSPVVKAGAPQGVSVVSGAPAAPATGASTAAAPATGASTAAAPATGASTATAPATGASTAAASTTAAPAGATPAGVVSVAAPPAPARVGWPPEQVYLMVCATCHEADGRGAIARKTMKDAELIPDLTDPKWQASRTDGDLEQSILQGKGKVMLARKDILTAAHTDVKEMVALMRRFRGGKQVITGVPTSQPPPAQPVPVIADSFAPTTPAAQPPPVAGPNPPTSTTPSAPHPVSTNPAQPVIGSRPSAPGSASPGFVTAPAGPSHGATGPGISLPEALPISTAPSPERAAKLRAASEFYRTNCFACHGTDGKGTLVRPLMPAIPDFTSREWQTSRTNTQLQTSIMEGKGTFMPPWTGKFTAEFARDLIPHVRAFGGPDLVIPERATSVAATNFENQIRALQVQWDEVERQLRELNLPPARP